MASSSSTRCRFLPTGPRSTSSSSLLGAYAFRLDGERLWPLWALPLQQFVYRQLMYLVVVQATISACAASPAWQHVERTGEIEVARGAS